MQTQLASLKNIVLTHKDNGKIALEFQPVDSVVEAYRSVVATVDSILDNLIGKKKPDAIPMDKNHTAFLTKLSTIPYTSLMQMKINIPEGFCSTFLIYLETLEIAAKNVSTVHNDIIKPYVKLMAKLVSDRDTLLSTDSEFDKLLELEIARDKLYDQLGSCFNNNVHTSLKYKDVIERNADMTKVLHLLNKLVYTCNSISHDDIMLDIKAADGYLEAIKSNLEEDEKYAKMVSKSTILKLANGTFQVAKEIEAISDFHYKVFVINASITSMIESISAAYGEKLLLL